MILCQGNLRHQPEFGFSISTIHMDMHSRLLARYMIPVALVAQGTHKGHPYALCLARAVSPVAPLSRLATPLAGMAGSYKPLAFAALPLALSAGYLTALIAIFL